MATAEVVVVRQGIVRPGSAVAGKQRKNWNAVVEAPSEPDVLWLAQPYPYTPAPPVVIEGFLRKQDKRAWSERLFRLDANVLHAYRESASEPPLLSIPLAGAVLVGGSDASSGHRIVDPDDELELRIAAAGEVVTLRASSASEHRRWMLALCYSQAYYATGGRGPIAPELTPSLVVRVPRAAVLSVRLTLSTAAGGATYELLVEDASSVHAVHVPTEADGEAAMLLIAKLSVGASPVTAAAALAPAAMRERLASTRTRTLPATPSSGSTGSAGCHGGDAASSVPASSAAPAAVGASARAELATPERAAPPKADHARAGFDDGACSEAGTSSSCGDVDDAPFDTCDASAAFGTCGPDAAFVECADGAYASRADAGFAGSESDSDGALGVESIAAGGGAHAGAGQAPTIDDAVFCVARAMLDRMGSVSPAALSSNVAALTALVAHQIQTAPRAGHEDTIRLAALEAVLGELSPVVANSPDLLAGTLRQLTELQATWVYMARKCKLVLASVQRLRTLARYKDGFVPESLSLAGHIRAIRRLLALRYVAGTPNGDAFGVAFDGDNARSVAERLECAAADFLSAALDRLGAERAGQSAAAGTASLAASAAAEGLARILATLDTLEPPLFWMWLGQSADVVIDSVAIWMAMTQQPEHGGSSSDDDAPAAASRTAADAALRVRAARSVQRASAVAFTATSTP